MRENLGKIPQLRGDFTRRGAQNMAKAALGRNLRSGSGFTYRPMGEVQVWNAKEKDGRLDTGTLRILAEMQ